MEIKEDRVAAELSHIALRLLRSSAMAHEDHQEMLECVASITNEIRDLKAELVALGDILVALENVQSKDRPRG